MWAAHPSSYEPKCWDEMVIFHANAPAERDPSGVISSANSQKCLIVPSDACFCWPFLYSFWSLNSDFLQTAEPFPCNNHFPFSALLKRLNLTSIQWWIVTKQWPFGAHILKRRISGNTIIQICWTPTLVQHTSVSFISLCFSVLLFKGPEAGFELTLSCSETADPPCSRNSETAYECVRMCVVISLSLRSFGRCWFPSQPWF